MLTHTAPSAWEHESDEVLMTALHVLLEQAEETKRANKKAR